MKASAICAGLLLLSSGLLAADPLLGKPAREWHADHWFNSSPLTLAGLRGKVVLIRWWTAPECPYCAATAPALNELHKTYADQGLVVIGFYHHKSASPLAPADVRRHAVKFGFRFPVAIDTGWRTLNDWWLDAGGQRWTSVSFLLDQEGRIRHIHEGGEYPPGSPDYLKLKSAIKQLLSESSTARDHQ